MLTAGYHRVHLADADAESDADYFTVYVPLDQDGRYDPSAPKPHFAKARWSGDDFLAEFVATGAAHNRFVWTGQDESDWLTDLLAAPLCLGAVIHIYEGDTLEYDCAVYTVKSVERL